jgi:zinc D-Ala-D-Ala carboxypeptidase
MSNWYWEYFKPEEVLSPEGLEQWRQNNCLLQSNAMAMLESFRLSLGMPILVNHGSHNYRGYRSSKENEAVGGVQFSRHVQGIAFDITVPEMDTHVLTVKASDFGWSFVLEYRDRGFVHIDMRSDC